MSGCSALPASGPAERAVEDGASLRIQRAGGSTDIGYVLVDLNREVLPYVTRPPRSSLRSFGGGRGGAPDIRLGIGDIVQLTIFESSSGGLFIPADSGTRPGNFINLPNQTIDRSGMLSVPYAGLVRADGFSVADVQRNIEERLKARAIEPQVVITIIQSRSSQVAVLGDVSGAGKFEVSPGGERILDMIARAGGLSTPGEETYVTLRRNGRDATVLFNEIAKHPEENIYVAPGDTLYVNRLRRTYLAFGATGLTGRFDFEDSELTLGEALGKAGGLLDARANPAQVLLYRLMPSEIVARMSGRPSKSEPGRGGSELVPVIFRANLRDPAGFFAVQDFAMRDRDIIYVTNSDSVELQKFLNIVNDVSATAGNVPVDVARAKRAVNDVR